MTEITDRTLHVQQLFVRYQGQLKAFALALYPNFAVAEDVLQEVFLAVTAKAAEFEPGTNFPAWAKAIVRFKVLEARRRLHQPELSDETLNALAASCPDDWAEDRRLAMLTQCMKTLAPQARELLRLRYHGEHSPAHIAKILDRTANSVNVALAKARSALRACLDRRLRQEGVS